ncbi:MAG: cation acetate symporter [Burkholderiaceae bacterium]|nr:cation acetate symporter [Burkholderiaceae bacterium]
MQAPRPRGAWLSSAFTEPAVSPARLGRIYASYAIGFAFFVLLLGVLEGHGITRQAIGYLFLGSTLLLYAYVGVINRTNDPAEYYVAGRRVPAMYNGMATAADWMSAASFIGIAGGVYLQGYAGLAFVMGWTGGYVLIALFLAPYLRKFGQWTVPDFLGARYGGHIPRLIAVFITVLCSFTYVVAQIYGVGLITSWLTGVEFTVGVFLGLTGVLVCSFLGGMKAVTWTQVAQYIVLIFAYLVPVAWIGIQVAGNPLPQVYYADELDRVARIEEVLLADPAEQAVRERFAARAAEAQENLANSQAAFESAREALHERMALAAASNDPTVIQQVERVMAAFPRTEAQARESWLRAAADSARAPPPVRQAEPFPGATPEARDLARRNFLALVFCLMLGTAALPHLLMRFYTTPTVRAARLSVAWALGFIVVLYLSAPALAVLAKFIVYDSLVGTSFGDLPSWVHAWTAVDQDLLAISDVNQDGRVQLAEIRINQDIVTLATPEIAGLPYVVSGLVAAGGLAAALSTADGLLLTIANALSHDLYFRVVNPHAPNARRVLMTKVLLLLVAALAAMVAASKPGGVLDMVSAAFSLAAAGFFPALVLGVFWKRATGLGAVAGMASGFGITLYYLCTTQPWLRTVFDVDGPLSEAQWWGIKANAAGVFGVPLGFAVIVLVSLVTPRPSRKTQDLVDFIRAPEV